MMGHSVARNPSNSAETLIQVVLLSSALLGVLGQRVKVEPEVVSYPGQTVNLRCQFANEQGTELTQVSWIWEPTDGKRDNIAVFHPTYGASYPNSALKGRVSFINPSLTNPSISITNVKMTDEGRYICEYATYPSGNEQGTTSLVMLAKPNNTASSVTVAAGTVPVVVARCISANGRPAAQISWVTEVNGNATNTTKPGADNTKNVIGEYWLIPTPADNGREISCVVNHRTQSSPETIKTKLSIEYPPKVTIVGYDGNWYMGRSNARLICQANGNPPPASVVWKALPGPMPKTVEIKQNTLTVLKVDDAVNTTFVCEVSNHLGMGSEQVTTMVREAKSSPSNAGVVAGAIIGVLLALLLVGVLIGVLVNRSRRQQQGYRGNASQGTYDIKTRIFGSKKTSKNGMGGNNNGPIYTYRESDSDTLTEKSNHINRNDGILNTTPTAHDILLSGEMDEAERRKFDDLDAEEEEERYDNFSAGQPVLQIRPHDEEMGSYLDDDMESQRDGSVISRTAVYV
ncbi:poliovirus receptor-like isoform X1 [Arapaima gigas]